MKYIKYVQERERESFVCLCFTVCDKHTTSTSFSHRHDGNHPLLSQQCWVCSVKYQSSFKADTKDEKCMIYESVFSLCVLLLLFLRSDMKQVKVQSRRNSHALQLPY